jgi:hypothetical protein
MVASAEIVACLVAIAAAVKVASVEYRRLRVGRQMTQALRVAIGELA